MKPFDLERALKGEPVITREGRKVSELHYFETCDDPGECVVTIIDGEMLLYYKDGNYFDDKTTEDDLFMAPRKVTKWAQIVKIKADVAISLNRTLFDSKEEARNAYCNDYFDVIDVAPISWEE